MEFSLDARTARLSAGEFSAFTVGPHDAGGGGMQGLWRAQLGTHWHNELRARAAATEPATEFETVIEGRVVHRGWTLTLSGRIDQLLRTERAVTLREIKTVTRPLPVDESELRRDYPEYFVQVATYAYLWRLAPLAAPHAQPSTLTVQLQFVEASSGLSQTVTLTPADDVLFRVQLERVAEFLDLRHRARERLRHLRFVPPFSTPRPGQETTQRDLAATFEQHPLVLFEAPTGFGKTGILLEFALGQLRSGHFDRALYLTSKSTGQIQVVRTLTMMTAPPADSPGPSTPVAAWHVRNKSEHCVNHTFHCVRDTCAYLDNIEARWAASGLARFYRDEHHARDLETLRAAGRDARICPYEITRASLAFNDVWIGDYNYVFAPGNRTLFFNQPGFDPARTLLLIDEAHNLPSRVADAHSHLARADDARAVLTELDHLHAPTALVRAWESWTHLLAALQPVEVLDAALEADVIDTLDRIAERLGSTPPDPSALGPHLAEIVWQTPQLAEWLANPALKRLLWTPRPGELHFTCIDASDTIGETLRSFGGAVFASATVSPADAFTEAIGLSLPPAGRSTRNPQLSTPPPTHLRAHTPWRDSSYDIAVDARVDTTYQNRARYYAATAATIAALHAASAAAVSRLSSLNFDLNAPTPCVAVFFPSYAYAEAIARELERGSPLRVSLQPKLRDLAAQSAWVDESLALSDALFLVLGSSFAESIDSLGGRITHAMVVGPALPEVNAVQRARLDEAVRAGLSREQSFRRVYQIPGLTRVNQALGRLVRAPGQRARVILHCRRFLEPGYASLLAPEYQLGTNLLDDSDLTAWLER
jgi:DNA excision repair protein ERCC-2